MQYKIITISNSLLISIQNVVHALVCISNLKNEVLHFNKIFSALILEEIALDSESKEAREKNLQEAEELHLQSLALATKAFGENNVQTAKHYGNLGRLYQSMQRFEVCI